MFSNLFTRRAFTNRFAALLPGLGLASALPSSASAPGKQETGGVRKLNGDGKPADPNSFITALIVDNGLIYIAGQGAHSHDTGETFPTDIENHTNVSWTMSNTWWKLAAAPSTAFCNLPSTWRRLRTMME